MGGVRYFRFGATGSRVRALFSSRKEGGIEF